MSIDNEKLFELLHKPIAKAAKSASFKWHQLLDAEEIESELWIEILESSATAAKLQGSDPDLVTDLLVRMADRICIGERDDYEHFTGNYRYSVNETKALVEEFFLRDGETLLAEFIDVDVAFGLLTDSHPNYAEAILSRYVLDAYDDDRDRNSLSRGLTKLTDMMNRNFKGRERDYRDGPGTRPRIPSGYDPYEGN